METALFNIPWDVWYTIGTGDLSAIALLDSSTAFDTFDERSGSGSLFSNGSDPNWSKGQNMFGEAQPAARKGAVLIIRGCCAGNTSLWIVYKSNLQRIIVAILLRVHMALRSTTLVNIDLQTNSDKICLSL